MSVTLFEQNLAADLSAVHKQMSRSSRAALLRNHPQQCRYADSKSRGTWEHKPIHPFHCEEPQEEFITRHIIDGFLTL